MILLALAACIFVSEKDLADWSDADGDGHVARSLGGDDCDDADRNVGVPAVSGFTDADGDGHGDAATEHVACALPAGAVATGDDCDDTDPAVFPGAAELCDGADQDCDGTPDDDPADPPTWYRDADEDGYGNAADTAEACEAPDGYVADGTDCNDDDAWWSGPWVHYPDDDADGFGVADPAREVLDCVWIDGFVENDDDCDDTNPEANPAMLEASGATFDMDCDGTVGDARVDQIGTMILGPYVDGRISAAAGIGDVVGEAGWELMVGIPGAGEVRMAEGRGRVGSLDQLDTVRLDAARSWWTGDPADEGGAALVAADFDGDGARDLAAGAPGTLSGAGAVHLFQSGWPVGALEPDVTVSGDGAERLGAVLGSGRLGGEGDDLPDLVLAAPAVDVVYVLAAPFTGASTLAGAARIEGLAGGELGAAVATGDADGNGVQDLLLGAPGADDAGTDAGAAWLCLGGAAGLTGVVALADACEPVLGGSRGDAFGAAVALVDLDHDGRDELFVGAPGVDGDAADVGVVYGLYADAALDDAGDAVWSIVGEEPIAGGPGARFGAALTRGEFNGAAEIDFAVGAPDYDEGNENVTGATYIFRGPLDIGRGRPAAWAVDRFTCLQGCASGTTLGVADFDAAGLEEVLAGSPGWLFDGTRGEADAVVSGAVGVLFSSAFE